LLVVEHDEETIRSADWIIDVGVGAGIHGGKIVSNGGLEELQSNKNSVTASYLTGEQQVYLKNSDRKKAKGWITLYGARENNLKSIKVSFPLGCITTVSGVSGSGKSTLVNDILFKALSNHFFSSKDKPGAYDTIIGVDLIDKVIGIDQSPIGRTPRSNSATYVNAFGPIREIFSKTVASRERGYKPGRFSFNVPGGRCDSCEGAGLKRIEMQFLPDVYVTCDTCKGKRYNSETLQITYKYKTISDILEMTVEESLEFFTNIPMIEKKLRTLYDVGLGYLKLGQPATTLSGGEAQRIKLSAELSKKDTGRTLYILDEPTTGLHFADVKKLLQILKRLAKLGNTIILIEHNLDVIASSDWVVDLGPGAGDKGGSLVVAGTPEEVANVSDSHTGMYLKMKFALLQTVKQNE
jgi:excinuclease ABC subunit A